MPALAPVIAMTSFLISMVASQSQVVLMNTLKLTGGVAGDHACR
jgi:hypothetical protein